MTPLIFVVEAASQRQCILTHPCYARSGLGCLRCQRERSPLLRCRRTALLGCERFSAVGSAAAKARFRCLAITSPSADLEPFLSSGPSTHGLLISGDVIFLSHSIFLWTGKGAWVSNWVHRIDELTAVNARSRPPAHDRLIPLFAGRRFLRSEELNCD